MNEEIINLLESKGLIEVEGDEDGIILRLNQDNEGWCGENIIDIFQEGKSQTLDKVSEFLEERRKDNNKFAEVLITDWIEFRIKINEQKGKGEKDE